jgi:anti-anti-sigma factor
MADVSKTAAVIRIAGSDAVRVPELESRVAQAVKRKGCRVVLDLGEAGSMDSLMLASLVGADKAISAVGGRMAIAAAPEVRGMLELTGLDTRLDLYQTSDAALLNLQRD